MLRLAPSLSFDAKTVDRYRRPLRATHGRPMLMRPFCSTALAIHVNIHVVAVNSMYLGLRGVLATRSGLLALGVQKII